MEQIGKIKPSLYPQKISNRDWYYEERHGLCLVHQIAFDETLIRTDQVLIPWKLIEATMRRRGWAPIETNGEKEK